MHRTVNRVIFNLQIKLNWVATTANFCCSMLMLFLLKFELLEVILNIEALLLLYSWWIELCDSELFSEFSNRFWWNSIFCPSEIHCEGLFSFRRLREDKHFQNWMFTSVSFHVFFYSTFKRWLFQRYSILVRMQKRTPLESKEKDWEKIETKLESYFCENFNPIFTKLNIFWLFNSSDSHFGSLFQFNIFSTYQGLFLLVAPRWCVAHFAFSVVSFYEFRWYFLPTAFFCLFKRIALVSAEWKHNFVCLYQLRLLQFDWPQDPHLSRYAYL